MDLVVSLLEQQPMMALFLTIAIGYLVGEINIKGFSLGVGAVLFVATNLVDRPVIFPGDALCPPEPALAWDEIARSRDSFTAWMGTHVLGTADHAAFLRSVGAVA